jgi:prepilin-type N-terminal cleavage/methylation domain-containing protein
MNTYMSKIKQSETSQNRGAAGFTLLELLVAMAMFAAIGGATFSMFAKNAPLFTQQQNTASLNIALQNAVSQLQLDLVNAGTGYYPSTGIIPSWPVGVSITNQVPTTACNVAATYTYTAACFDSLYVLTINPGTVPYHPTNSAGSTTAGADSLTTSSPFYIQPNTGQTAAQLAAAFTTGEQLLLITSGTTSSGTQLPTGTGSTTTAYTPKVNTIVLTANPTVCGANCVALTFNPSNADGTNSSTNDPVGISSTASANLGTIFHTTDWVMLFTPTHYYVDATTNPQDPTLIRQASGGPANIIAEQIIGFKVGAATSNASDTTSTPTYSFAAQNQPSDTPIGYGNDFTLVRSVRVTMIGRTPPNPTAGFANTFDGGPYQVLGADVVVNPRNMSMNYY